MSEYKRKPSEHRQTIEPTVFFATLLNNLKKKCNIVKQKVETSDHLKKRGETEKPNE